MTPYPTQSTQRSAPSRVIVAIGIGFAALYTGGFLSSGGADAATPGSELVADQSQSEAVQFALGTSLTVAAILLVFFGAWLRGVLSDQGRSNGWLADAAFAGTALMALTLSLFVTTAHAVQDGIDSGEPLVAQALNIADANTFFPAMLGLACVLIATGAGSFSNGLLPKWLAASSVALGVMAPLSKAGFAPFMLFPFWVALVAVIGSRPRAAAVDAVSVRSVTTGA